MGVSVAAEDPPCVRRIHAGQAGRRHQQQTAEPCGYKPRRIVQARRRRAKILISLILVTKHGVHGIDRFVGHTADRASERKVEKRCDDAVRRVLGHGLHSRPDDSFPVQILRVASHDHRYRAARFGKASISRCQRFIYLHRRIPKISGCQRIAAQNRFRGNPRRGVQPVKSYEQSPCDPDRRREHEYGYNKTLEPEFRCRVFFPAQEFFQRRDQRPHKAYRMRHPLRIPDQAVQPGPYQNTDQPIANHKTLIPKLSFPIPGSLPDNRRRSRLSQKSPSSPGSRRQPPSPRRTSCSRCPPPAAYPA